MPLNNLVQFRHSINWCSVVFLSDVNLLGEWGDQGRGVTWLPQGASSSFTVSSELRALMCFFSTLTSKEDHELVVVFSLRMLLVVG